MDIIMQWQYTMYVYVLDSSRLKGQFYGIHMCNVGLVEYKVDTYDCTNLQVSINKQVEISKHSG